MPTTTRATRPATQASASTGIPLPRRDGRPKVTGAATFAADWPIEGLTYAVAVGSTIARGRLTAIDASAARRVPGVIAVMTHENAPRLNKPAFSYPRSATLTGILPVIDTQIRHEGQYVAVAVATSLEAAKHAATLVRCTFAAEPPEVDLLAHLGRAERAAAITGDKPLDEVGNAPAALLAAPASVDAIYETSAENHNAIEPHGTIAHFHAPEPDGVELTVYDATQNIHGQRDLIAQMLGMDVAKVRVVCKLIGGAFGGKGPVWTHVILAANVARFVKRPVRLVLGRDQLYGGVGGRPASRQRIALGAHADGRLTAIVHEAASACGRVDTYVQDQIKVSAVMYASETRRLVNEFVRLDITCPAFMRSPSKASSMFATESAMDELAVKLGMDPIELRHVNEPKVEPASGKPFSGRLLMPCFDQGAREFGWAERPREPRSRRQGRWLIGMGCAAATYPALARPTSARITLRADGSAIVECGTHEMGGGTTTSQAQLAADLLGLPVRRVTVIIGDTRLPRAPSSGGAWGTVSVGNAIRVAADELKKQLLALAGRDADGPLAGVTPEQLVLRAGRLERADDATRGVELARLLEAGFRESVTADGQFAPPSGGAGPPTANHSFGAGFCEVAVDEPLGVVRVRQFNGCYACGRVVNAQTARSQFIGGIVWGIGQALLEHTVRDAQSGRVTNDNLAEYHVPVCADVPTPSVSWIDEPDYNVSPIGAKGLGEIGNTGVAAAIANAIYNATGKRLRRLPILPEHVMSA